MALSEERADLQQQLHRRTRELDAIWRVTQALATVTDEASLARMALHTALEVVEAEAGSILLYDPALGQLVFTHVEGGGGSRLEGRCLPITEGIAGQVFTSHRARISRDMTVEKDHARAVGEEVGYATRNMITVPLSPRGGQPVGVMQVLNKRTGDLDEHDLHLLEMLGSQVALAIEQARLYQETKLAEVARLLGDIAHDLKNMITPVVASASLLEQIIRELMAAADQSSGRGGDEPDRRSARYPDGLHGEALAILREAAHRVQSRVKEIADCVQGITAPLRLSPCDVNWVAKQVLDMLRPAADQDGIALLLQPCADQAVVEADEDRLFSMLYNLTDNAMSAVRRAARPGRVVIATSAAPAAVAIEVSDTGCGMGQETLDRLFTTGVRSSTALGTGLGTKIVKDVVEVHGGKIGVESTLDVGTTFRVELPVSQKRAQPG